MGDLNSLLRLISASKGELDVTPLQFRANVSTSGSGGISYPTDDPNQDVDLDSDYDYYIIELRSGYTQAGKTGNAGTADGYFNDIDEISFNIKDTGASQDLFDTNIELNTLVSGDGERQTPIHFWPGGKAIRADAKLKLNVTVRAASLSLARVITPQLVCLKVPKGFHLKPE